MRQAAIHGATIKGRRPSRSHDYHFVGEPPDSVLVVGREMRRSWSEVGTDGGPVALRMFAELALSFRRPPDGRSSTEKGGFGVGFRKTVTEFQERLQSRGEAPSLALTMAFVRWPRLHIGHIGDSRCYLLRGQKLRRITTDQTFAAQPPDRPLVSDPALSRQLSSVVGGFSEDIAIQVIDARLEPSDTLLLCTSGVSQVLSDRVLQQLLLAPKTNQRHASLRALAKRVLDAAGERQTESDRTAVLARFPETEAQRTEIQQ